MPDSRMLSLWFLQWVSRVVDFQLLPGPVALTFLVPEFTKHKHTIRISYTIILPRRNVPVVRIELLYSTEKHYYSQTAETTRT